MHTAEPTRASLPMPPLGLDDPRPDPRSAEQGAKVRAGRRRSWVLPGHGAMLYLMMIGGLTTAAVYTQANLLFWGVGLTLGAGAVSLAWATLTLWGVSVERLRPTHAAVGESAVLRYRVTNRSWLPVFSVQVREVWRRGGPVREQPQRLKAAPLGWLIEVTHGRSAQVEAWCWPARRGWLRWETIEMTSSFPFGVLRKRLRIDEPGAMLVYPRVHRLVDGWVAASASWTGGVGEARHKLGEGDEFYGLRTYRPGDDLRLIDWRRSARTGSLVARETARPVPPRTSIVLDLRGTAAVRAANGRAAPDPAVIDDEENALSLAASILDASFNAGHRVGFAVLGAEAPSFAPHTSPLHRTRLLEALACLDCAKIGNPAMPGAFRATLVVASRPALDQAWPRNTVVWDARRLADYVTDAPPSAGASPAPARPSGADTP